MIASLLGFLISGRGLKAMAGVALVVGLAWSHLKAYNAGEAANEARHVEATRELNDRLEQLDERSRVREAENRRLQQERDALERDLIAGAAGDPNSDLPGLGAGSLRRLNSIR